MKVTKAKSFSLKLVTQHHEELPKSETQLLKNFGRAYSSNSDSKCEPNMMGNEHQLDQKQFLIIFCEHRLQLKLNFKVFGQNN